MLRDEQNFKNSKDYEKSKLKSNLKGKREKYYLKLDKYYINFIANQMEILMFSEEQQHVILVITTNKFRNKLNK